MATKDLNEEKVISETFHNQHGKCNKNLKAGTQYTPSEYGRGFHLFKIFPRF